MQGWGRACAYFLKCGVCRLPGMGWCESRLLGKKNATQGYACKCPTSPRWHCMPSHTVLIWRVANPGTGSCLHGISIGFVVFRAVEPPRGVFPGLVLCCLRLISFVLPPPLWGRVTSMIQFGARKGCAYFKKQPNLDGFPLRRTLCQRGNWSSPSTLTHHRS